MATRHPRWVRVNAIKTTLEQQLKTTFARYEEVKSLEEVLSARGTAKVYFRDPNIPNLLALPPKINLSRTSAYTDGRIILQDKASCFPACLLDLSPADGDVVDGCAAPGNKTTHLAAIISSSSASEQKVIAFERDETRTKTLQKMVKLASADSIVSIKGGTDFLAAKPHSNEFAHIGAILLDPSCSGSGIVGRDDGIKIHLPVVKQAASKTKKRKRGDVDSAQVATLTLDMHDTATEETPTQPDRLATLSNFQLHILTHAMRFPSARKITYSTCSVHFQENEGVVFQALASSIAKQRGWKILTRERQVEGMKAWKRRGVWEDGKEVGEDKDTVLEACIRCEKGTEDGTMGFFVAGFVRGEGEMAEGGEEWNGFSGGEEEELVDVNATETKSTKKKKKRKKAAT